jgi:hypothetical protein
MQLAPIEFTEWFNKWLTDSALGIREASRKIGISHPMVSDLQSGARPTQGTCVKLAIAADLPTDYVLSLAGYRPKIDERTALIMTGDLLLEKFKTERYQRIAVGMLDGLVKQEETELSNTKKQTGSLRPAAQKI